MTKLMGEFTIKMYENNKAFIEYSPNDGCVLGIMFAFYLDRVSHNLSQGVSFGLINQLVEQNIKWTDSTGKGDKVSKSLEKASFGWAPQILEKESDKKVVFEANGEYFNKKEGEFYLQTKFKPILIKNDKLELYALSSVIFLYEYILAFGTERTGIFLMTVLNNMTRKYIEGYERNKKLSSIGEVPSEVVSKVAEAFFRELGSLA